MNIKYVTGTHIHADSLPARSPLLKPLARSLPSALTMRSRIATAWNTMRSGMVTRCESVCFVWLRSTHRAITPEHLSFVLFDEERNASQPLAVFTGDFLFVGSLGCPDLLGEEAKQALAHELYRSLHERIASLPDGVQVYPGHGAGCLCGAGMSEQAKSTLGYERLSHPLFGSRWNSDGTLRQRST